MSPTRNPPTIRIDPVLSSDPTSHPPSILTPVTPEAVRDGFQHYSVLESGPLSPTFQQPQQPQLRMQGSCVKISVAAEVQQASNAWTALAAGKILIDRGLYDLASRSFLHGIRLGPSGLLLNQLVEYNYFSRLLSSIDAYASSVQASSLSARDSMLIYATAAATVPHITNSHSFLAQLLLVSGQLNLGNLSTAIRTLAAMRRVAGRTQAELRAIYALERQAVSRGDAVSRDQYPIPRVPDRVCYGSLRIVPALNIMLACTLCPGKFCEEGGYANGQRCTLCRKGLISKFEVNF